MRTDLVKTATEIEAMRVGGLILATVLNTLKTSLEPGMTTGNLDEITRRELAKLGAKPAFLGYQGFPASICISVNQEVVHGIPGSKVIIEGDIVGLDLGVWYEGLITDGAITVSVGQISADAEKLLVATQDALRAGVTQAKTGNRVGDISAAIGARLRRDNLGIIQELSGHGVGRSVHEEPVIPNFGHAGKGLLLQEGMTLAIEPMASLGAGRVILMEDGWTYETSDGSLASQHEHTVVVTRQGGQILTTQ
jgi:methionyl aminopeptidase